MEYEYITDTLGLGGRIKQLAEDFEVCEITKDSKIELKYIKDNLTPEIDWDKIEQEKEDKEYLILDLEKFNMSTTTAIKLISRFLRISKKRLSYAGLKDKRATTSQKISILNPDIERLKKFKFNNIKLSNPIWADNPVDIGDLKENEFRITIRKIEGLEFEKIKEILNNSFSQIQKKGLPNYFGEQRFGGIRKVTHEVGKSILKRNYKRAVITYLTKTHDLEREDIRNARNELKKDLNFSKHAAHFPSKTGYESAILNYLAKHPEDYLGAIKVLPKGIQFLFIHAYQSYLFNNLINLRIEKGYGLEQIDGDTILNQKVHLPLFGFESSFSKKKAGELEKQVLEKEGIDFKEFYNPDYSVLSSKGDFRALKMSVNDFNILDVSEDEYNKEENPNFKKAKISFSLEKGKYATVFLREIIKKEIIG